MIIEAIVIGLFGGAAAAAARRGTPTAMPAAQPQPIAPVQAEVAKPLPEGVKPAQAATKPAVTPPPGKVVGGGIFQKAGCPPGYSLQPSSRQANALMVCRPTQVLPMQPVKLQPAAPKTAARGLAFWMPSITPNKNTAAGSALKQGVLKQASFPKGVVAKGWR